MENEKMVVTLTENGVSVQIAANGKMHLDMMLTSLIASLLKEDYTIADIAENTARAMEMIVLEAQEKEFEV